MSNEDRLSTAVSDAVIIAEELIKTGKTIEKISGIDSAPKPFSMRLPAYVCGTYYIVEIKEWPGLEGVG